MAAQFDEDGGNVRQTMADRSSFGDLRRCLHGINPPDVKFRPEVLGKGAYHGYGLLSLGPPFFIPAAGSDSPFGGRLRQGQTGWASAPESPGSVEADTAGLRPEGLRGKIETPDLTRPGVGRKFRNAARR